MLRAPVAGFAAKDSGPDDTVGDLNCRSALARLGDDVFRRSCETLVLGDAPGCVSVPDQAHPNAA